MIIRKVIASVSLAVFFITCVLTNAPVFAAEQARLNYVVVKTGIYNPTGDLDNFDTGLNIEGVFGRYFHKNFALEGGIGLFGTKAEYSGTSALLGTYTEENKIAAIPLTVTAKGLLPLDKLELYAGAGLGVYLASADAELRTSNLGNFTLDDNDIVFGLHLTAGGIYNITERFFFGIDTKYLSTEEASFKGTALGQTYTIKSDLTGYTVNGLFGYRF
jgi:opacity protein-like surface antigen